MSYLTSILSSASVPHIVVASSIPETIEINGDTLHTRNSLGKLIHPTLTGIRNFWNWFDGSKVVDEHGRPLVCYHGTRKDFEFLDGYEIPGWVSEDVDLAETYSESTVYDDSTQESDEDDEDGDPVPAKVPASNIMPLYVRVTNPFIVHENLDDVHEDVNTADFMQKCEREGHDGIFGHEGNTKTWAIFHPSQAKSVTGNNGNYSGGISVTASASNAKRLLDAYSQGAPQGIAVHLEDYTEDEVELVSIEAAVKNRGTGTQAMSHLCDCADRLGINLFLIPSAHGTAKFNRLVAFYERFGFELDGEDTMRREAQQEATASSALTFNTPRVPLDFDALYGKAFKVTDTEGDPKRDGFSIITPFANRGVWSAWKEKPQFKAIVRKNLNNPRFLADHKYVQVVDAAKKLGLM